MTPEDLIREISQQIVQEQLLHNGIFYLVLLALLFLSSVTTAFVGSYIQKRGETYATKADFEQLISQLRATTTAAEEVRTEIAHSDWTNKEWKTLRRVKLEELLGAVYAVQYWLDKELSGRLYNYNQSRESELSPFWKVDIIASLYFPDLCDEVKVLSEAYHCYNIWVLQSQGRLLEAGNDSARRTAVFEAVSQEIKPHHEKLLQSISEIQRKAPAIMKEIVGI